MSEPTDKQWITSLHQEKEEGKWYGQMVVNYEAGKIVTVKQTETKKKPKK